MPTNEQAHGNREAVAILERYLEMARSGQFGYAAVALCRSGTDQAAFSCGGAIGCEPTALRALLALQEKVECAELNRTLPPRDPALGADFVCYNIPAAPCSYDFLAWLVDAEMTRLREGAPAPLKVAFWFGRDGKTGLAMPSRRQMFENVMRPALALICAVEDERALQGRHKAWYTIRDIAAASRAGEKVPLLRLPVWTEDVISITLREAAHWPHRNSDIEAWSRFARDLQRQGERVIFVRDTAKADEPLADFETHPLASRDLHVRMALYESAKANLFTSNGPAALATFGSRPWLQFIDLQPDGHPYHVDTPSFFRDSMGIAQGQQHPWSTPAQRIVWAPASYENIVSAWENLKKAIAHEEDRYPAHRRTAAVSGL